MNINKYQQRGMSGSTIAAVLFLFVLSMMIFFKLFPVYMDNMTVESALQKLIEHPKLAQKPNRDVERLFSNYVDEKNIQPFGDTPIAQVLTIKRDSDTGTVEATVKYNREVKFQGNLYFLIKFETIVGTP